MKGLVLSSNMSVFVFDCNKLYFVYPTLAKVFALLKDVPRKELHVRDDVLSGRATDALRNLVAGLTKGVDGAGHLSKLVDAVPSFFVGLPGFFFDAHNLFVLRLQKRDGVRLS